MASMTNDAQGAYAELDQFTSSLFDATVRAAAQLEQNPYSFFKLRFRVCFR